VAALLIELIWTRLSNQFKQYFPMDDTLEMERLAPFLSARIVRHGQTVGWKYWRHVLKKDELSSIEPTRWAPQEVNENEWVILQQVSA
jgi:hypothetical protein